MKTIFKLLILVLLLNSCTKEVITIQEVAAIDEIDDASLEELSLSYIKTITVDALSAFNNALMDDDSALLLLIRR